MLIIEIPIYHMGGGY